MRYKALLLDIDGTISPHGLHAQPLMPNKQVIKAISQAKQKVFVGLATARPFSKARPILEKLKLNGYTILLNGIQIINSENFRTVWKKLIDKQTAKAIFRFGKKLGLKAHSADMTRDFVVRSEKQIDKRDIGDIFYLGLTKQKLNQLQEQLSQFSNITTHTMFSGQKGFWELAVTDIKASKQHAVLHVCKLLKIKPKEVIAVGDGPNDFPLLMPCGLKIAMGNAVSELKAIADFIAPPVEEDGVVTVIKKFILEK